MSTTPLAAARRPGALLILALLVLGFTAALVPAASPALAVAEDAGDDDANRLVEILPLRDGFIDPPVTDQVLDVLDVAEEGGAELVVLQYSSGGGVSVDLDRLLGRVGGSSVPVAALIGPLGTGAEAAGAAGLLWLAADVRAISVDARVGPLDPADLTDLAGDVPIGDLARELVLAAGGDATLADRLVREAVPAEDLVEAGVVTLTAQGLEPLLAELDGVTIRSVDGEPQLRLRGDEVQIRLHSLGLVRRLLHAATTAPFIYLLLVMGLGLLLFEVFQPGFGVAGLAGVLTLAIGGFGLTVLPVTWWAVALVVLGLVLYAIDTAVAGFGAVTVAATAAFGVGSWFFYAHEALALPWWLVAITTLTALVFFVLVMTTILRAQAGPDGVAVEELVGRPGTVRSVLNPEGHVYIDGALWRARWIGDTRRAKVGTPVQVSAVEGPVVLVVPFDGADRPAEAADQSAE